MPDPRAEARETLRRWVNEFPSCATPDSTCQCPRRNVAELLRERDELRGRIDRAIEVINVGRSDKSVAAILCGEDVTR